MFMQVICLKWQKRSLKTCVSPRRMHSDHSLHCGKTFPHLTCSKEAGGMTIFCVTAVWMCEMITTLWDHCTLHFNHWCMYYNFQKNVSRIGLVFFLSTAIKTNHRHKTTDIGVHQYCCAVSLLWTFKASNHISDRRIVAF